VHLSQIYERACEGRPIVFDMRPSTQVQRIALVKAMVRAIEQVCADETQHGQRRYPYIFFEEAHLYVSYEAIVNIITRGRHIGISSIFASNTPQALPEAIFRQLDNLFLLGLNHEEDIASVSKISFAQPETIGSIATRLAERQALVVGQLIERFPLVVSIDPLPEGVPSSGRTRSTWERFG
jgi:uncharacterized protein